MSDCKRKRKATSEPPAEMVVVAGSEQALSVIVAGVGQQALPVEHIAELSKRLNVSQATATVPLEHYSSVIQESVSSG